MQNLLKKIRDSWPKIESPEPWQIVAARYCVEHSEKGFTEESFKTFVHSLYSVTDEHVVQFLQEEIHFPSGSKFQREMKGNTWIPPLELVSKVTEYDELKEARKNAVQAWRMSLFAIIITAIGVGVQALEYVIK